MYTYRLIESYMIDFFINLVTMIVCKSIAETSQFFSNTFSSLKFTISQVKSLKNVIK